MGPSEDMDSAAEEAPKPVVKTIGIKKKVASEVSDEESDNEDDPKASKSPDISDESEEDEPKAKPTIKPQVAAPPVATAAAPVATAAPPRPMLIAKASPFPKAPPPGDESDSDDGFQSPATPSEDEDED